MSHEEEKHKREILDEMIENYESIKKLGKWALGIVVFFGAVLYAIVELRKIIMK